MSEKLAQPQETKQLNSKGGFKSFPKACSNLLAKPERGSIFCCFVQILNYKVIIFSEGATEHLTMVFALSPFPAILMLFFQWTTILLFGIFRTSRVTSERMWCGSWEHMSPNPTMASSSPQSAVCSRWNRADSWSHSLSFSQKRPASW